MNPLQRFYNDKEMYNAVYRHIIDNVKEYAGEQAIQGKDTSGIKDANDILQKSFAELEKSFNSGIIKKVEHSE
jgi:hypothetical protein